MNNKIDEIREKWLAAKGKPVDISFPKIADPLVVKCFIDAARGDVYTLLDELDRLRSNHILDRD